MIERENLLIRFSDGSEMVFTPLSSVRIANRGPSSVQKKDFELVRSHPPEWWGFGSFHARILAIGHRVQTHRGLLEVVYVEHDVDQPAGDPAVVRRGQGT